MFVYLIVAFTIDTLALCSDAFDPVYDDAVTRAKFFPLAAAAYSDDPAQCVKNIFGTNATIVRSLVLNCTEGIGDTCAGFSAVSHNDRAMIFSFRGTSSFLQLVFESGETLFKAQVNSSIGGHVGAYFAEVFDTLWKNGLKDDYIMLHKKYPQYKIWITGHSLGGAVASIASAEIASMDQQAGDRIRLVTFGQPRTGDSDYSTSHDDYVWYNNDMSRGRPFTVCKLFDEDDSCSDGLVPLYILDDHLTYFGVRVSKFGESGCKR